MKRSLPVAFTSLSAVSHLVWNLIPLAHSSCPWPHPGVAKITATSEAHSIFCISDLLCLAQILPAKRLCGFGFGIFPGSMSHILLVGIFCLILEYQRHLSRIDCGIFPFAYQLWSNRAKNNLWNQLAESFSALICAIVADSRGRNPLGWFFIGFFLSCFSLFILLVLPDLKVMERRESLIHQENRRLREQIRRDRALSDSRFSETMQRIDAHDQILQVDTSPPPALPVSFGQLDGDEFQPLSEESAAYIDASWWYADPREGVQIGPHCFCWSSGNVESQCCEWRHTRVVRATRGLGSNRRSA